MKALLATLVVLLAAATAVVSGRADAVTTLVSQPWSATEPTMLLFSGSALLGLAGALRRLPARGACPRSR